MEGDYQYNPQTLRGARLTLASKVRLIAALIVVCYIVCYLILSWHGQYLDELTVSGKLKLASGSEIADARIWEPQFMIYWPGKLNFPGFLCAPLIWADRKFWHKDIYVLGESPDATGKMQIQWRGWNGTNE